MRYTYKTEQTKVGQIPRARSDVTANPSVLSFSNGCALILEPEALENVCMMIIHYLNMNKIKK